LRLYRRLPNQDLCFCVHLYMNVQSQSRHPQLVVPQAMRSAEARAAATAFDKSDLMYLRDEEERQRFTEDELRDRELQQFQRQRARVEPAAPGPAPTRPVRRDKERAGARCCRGPVCA